MQINLSEVKEYLRLEDTNEDPLIQILIDGAVSHCETILNRPILDVNMTAENTWTVPNSIRMAIYLLVSHWYEQRSPVGESTEEMSFSISSILGPHRFRNV